MSNVFTYTTEIKQNSDNQLLVKYISDYLTIFNKIQRIAFHRIKHSYIKYGKLDSKVKNELVAELKEEFNLTSRARDSIVYNMAGRFESIKELKAYELNQLYKRKNKFENVLIKLLDQKTLMKTTKINQKYVSKEHITTYKNLKIKIYWTRNKLNKINQRILNLENEIATSKFKICFGTKNNLHKDYQTFVNQRDSELYFIGRAGDIACNTNFQLEYNKRNNQFYLKIRKEINLEDGKYEYGKVYFNKKQKHKIKHLLSSKTSPLTYRIKIKNDKILLQLMFQEEIKASDCLTRNTYGTIGVDFNKGFVSVTETDSNGNMVNTFNLNYRFGQGTKTKADLINIANLLTDLCLEKGKDLVVEKLDFRRKKAELISKKGSKYNEMLSSLAYSTYGNIIKSSCYKKKVYLREVNPAWTSYIGKNKYANNMKLNIHTSASFVIARRGMFLFDSLTKKKIKKQKPRYKKYEKRTPYRGKKNNNFYFKVAV